mgnify:FL=1
MLLFKGLVNGRSCHGGAAEYPPPGEWTARISPSCCKSGWHLTSDPLRWWTPKASLWLAEGDGLLAGDGSDKAAFERVRIVEQITTLSRLDSNIDDFEFALGYLIRRRLRPEPPAARMSSLPPAALAGEISLVLSMLAHTGQTNPQDAAAAWEAGVRGLTDTTDGASLFPGIALVTQGLDDLTAIENALERLIRLTPICKRELLNTGMRIISHDHTITDAEENMIAAIADAIHAYGWQMAA